MTRSITGWITAAFSLIALYLVLRNGANASKLIGAMGTSAARVFKTLQGR